ncbi:hypothetical protein [Fimbriiglobus ruber]|uniref:Uncharacterized protein n=1 Tax=Fimbriiglobus ruber TaxID=1908690 RepID=A0A225DL15_9BACT|nr:hypothetical protein [Fimbriiglobus ruber]OWK41653.1 hypothetical protein FRUB_03731 [Fimbriiglobus ruber]
MVDANPGADFRAQATVVFAIFMAALVVIAFGLTALGWWLGRWWGAAIGAVVGALLFLAGLAGAGLLYAMTQDGA